MSTEWEQVELWQRRAATEHAAIAALPASTVTATFSRNVNLRVISAITGEEIFQPLQIQTHHKLRSLLRQLQHIAYNEHQRAILIRLKYEDYILDPERSVMQCHAATEPMVLEMIAEPLLLTWEQLRAMPAMRKRSGRGGKAACIYQRQLRTHCLEKNIDMVQLGYSEYNWRLLLKSMPCLNSSDVIGPGIVGFSFRLLKEIDPNYDAALHVFELNCANGDRWHLHFHQRGNCDRRHLPYEATQRPVRSNTVRKSSYEATRDQCRTKPHRHQYTRHCCCIRCNMWKRAAATEHSDSDESPERRIAADTKAYTYTEFVAWYRTHADRMWERAWYRTLADQMWAEHSHSRTSLVATHALSAPEPPSATTENTPYSAAVTPLTQLPHRQATEPTTPNDAATEHAYDDNTEPRGSDATEHAAIHSHVEWHYTRMPHATTVMTSCHMPHATCHHGTACHMPPPPSTCDLCKGPGNVEVWHENAGTFEICSTTWIIHVNMFRQTYAYTVQVCHSCYEACPYTTQEERRLHALLQGDANQMVALVRIIFVAWTLPSIAAHKVTDYLFPLVAVSE